MALSRLRQPVIARAPSLFRARRRLSSVFSSSSSSTSLYRTNGGENSLVDVNGILLSTNGGENSLVDVNGILLRPSSSTLVPGVHDSSLKLKMQIGVRHFSSSGLPSYTVLGMPALSPTMVRITGRS